MTFLEWLMGRIMPPAPKPEPKPAPEPPGVDVTGVVALVNAVRAKHKLPPLTCSPRLMVYAQAWADAMHTVKMLEHGDLADRLRLYPTSGECIAYGQQTASDVVASWERHPTHFAVMTGPAYTIAGVGRSGNYWCLDVARER